MFWYWKRPHADKKTAIASAGNPRTGGTKSRDPRNRRKRAQSCRALRRRSRCRPPRPRTRSGQPVILTATVPAASPTPNEGMVTFTDAAA